MDGGEHFLHPHLHRLSQRALAVRTATEQLVSGLSEEQLTWRPAPDRWSIAHCLDHLTRTGAAYRERLEPVLKNAPAGGSWEFRPHLPARLLLWAVDPATRRRFPAPRPFRPPPQPLPGSAARFLEEQDRLLALIRAGADRDLRRGRFGSPVTPLLRLSPIEGLTIVTLHTERHLNQARRVREDAGFPIDVA